MASVSDAASTLRAAGLAGACSTSCSRGAGSSVADAVAATAPLTDPGSRAPDSGSAGADVFADFVLAALDVAVRRRVAGFGLTGGGGSSGPSGASPSPAAAAVASADSAGAGSVTFARV